MKYVAKSGKRKSPQARKLPKCVRPEEFKKLIAVIPRKDIISRVAFLLAYGSGMRVSEVINLTREHLNDNSIQIIDSKYGRDRIIPLPKGWKKEFNAVIPIKKTVRSLERRFVKYKKLSKINPLYTFHSLRHGFATRCVESGIPLNQLMVLMGHSDLSTTSIYTKAAPVDALKSYEEMF